MKGNWNVVRGSKFESICFVCRVNGIIVNSIFEEVDKREG